MSQKILAIDPGTEKSAFVIWDGSRIHEAGILENIELLRRIKIGDFRNCDNAVEMIASYGMAVGREVFDTCVWIGRFVERLGIVTLVYRKDVKLTICGSPRAKDANVRVALIDRLGQVGTKNNPGPLYGMKSHLWSALAVAITAMELEDCK